LLEPYSYIPLDEIDAHVIAIVTRIAPIPILHLVNPTRSVKKPLGFAVFYYSCIDCQRFLDLYITTAPDHPYIIALLMAGEKLLSLCCCFGLPSVSSPSTTPRPRTLQGADLRPDFVELGYKLFRSTCLAGMIKTRLGSRLYGFSMPGQRRWFWGASWEDGSP